MLQKRPLGKTGEQLSIIGLGGIVVSGIEQSEANSIVAEAFDRGVNYFDVAPSYGNAEERLGPALWGKRDQVFLACKTAKRKKDEAWAELGNSLKNLRTDHFDLYQLHGLASEDDFRQVIGPGGALEALVEAREKGLVRYLGFSAHSVEVALKLMDAFQFDSVLFPINWINYFNANFGPQVVERARALGMGCLALKGMAKTLVPPGEERKYAKCWYEPIDKADLAGLALRFTLSQPITAAIPPGEPELFWMALGIGERFTELSGDELAELRRRAEGLTPIFKLSA